jgi:septum formation protein
MAEKIILASGSPFRKAMLVNAGLDIEAVPADVDERALEAPLKDSDVSPEDVASILAEAKATEVSERRPGSLVLGCDQTLSLGDEVFHKPSDMEGARMHLLALSGKTHQLNSAAVLCRDGEVLWRHVGVASLTMRKLDPAFIGRHLARVGAKALGSVGAYQVEGEGIQLFEKIEGDYFTIVGLPLLPVLKELRDLGAIDG